MPEYVRDSVSVIETGRFPHSRRSIPGRRPSVPNINGIVFFFIAGARGIVGSPPLSGEGGNSLSRIGGIGRNGGDFGRGHFTALRFVLRFRLGCRGILADLGPV